MSRSEREVAPAGTPLTAEEIRAQLAILPGWALLPGGSGIFCDYPFTSFGGAALFLTYCTGLVCHLPFAIDWQMDLIGHRVAVALGPLRGPLTAEILLLAGVVGDIARLNHLEEEER